MPKLRHQEVLIIGTGAAGLGLALSICSSHRVSLLSKGHLNQGSSRYAQGGIAAVLEQTSEALAAHVDDTLVAGAGLCNRQTVELVVNQGKAAIEWLIQQGVQFTLNQQRQFHLGQEAAHSKRRIYHVADHTGDAVVSTLDEQVQREKNITCYTEHTAIDLLVEEGRCVGAIVLNNQSGEIEHFLAQHTVLATGGAAYCYQHSTNPDKNTGDGIAMAYRAGCDIKHMEFTQFHPTAFHHPDSPPFLISEAVRGEGGQLKGPNNERFMAKYDERLELAPRDIVARAIDHELKTHQLDYVLLDISHQPTEQIQSHFPTIYTHCLKYGIDITKQPIPIVPAAHYTCGGVVTDLNGVTSLPGLYAIGEVACTGLHGANRLASNSLLECLVFAMQAAKHIRACEKAPMPYTERLSTAPLIPNIDAKTIRYSLWEGAGIVRTTELLMRAQATLEVNKKAHSLNKSVLELRNMHCCAQLIIEAALSRTTSCGAHFRQDSA